jgi:hypothetical protein
MAARFIHQQTPPSMAGRVSLQPDSIAIPMYCNSHCVSSLSEELNTGKARLHLVLCDSPDESIQEVRTKVKLGRTWNAAESVEASEASLRIKDIIGATPW